MSPAAVLLAALVALLTLGVVALAVLWTVLDIRITQADDDPRRPL